MPGIDSRAPERTDTSSGSSASPSRLPAAVSSRASASSTCSSRPSGSAAVLHVEDARLGRDREARGHALGAEDARHLGDVRALAAEQIAHLARPLGEVIDVLRRSDARFTPRSYLGTAGRSRTLGVMLERFGDRAVRLAQRELARARHFGQRRAQRAGQKLVRLLRQREARRLAGSCTRRRPPMPEKPRQVVGLAARGARGELRREAGGKQQLEAKGELIGVRRVRRRRPVPASSSASSLTAARRRPVRVLHVANSRDTASHARAAESSARGALAQPRMTTVVCALVTVRRSLRPSYSTHMQAKIEAPTARRSELRARRTPWRSRSFRPRCGVYRCRMRSASPKRIERSTTASVLTEPGIR